MTVRTFVVASPSVALPPGDSKSHGIGVPVVLSLSPNRLPDGLKPRVFVGFVILKGEDGAVAPAHLIDIKPGLAAGAPCTVCAAAKGPSRQQRRPGERASSGKAGVCIIMLVWAPEFPKGEAGDQMFEVARTPRSSVAGLAACQAAQACCRRGWSRCR